MGKTSLTQLMRSWAWVGLVTNNSKLSSWLHPQLRLISLTSIWLANSCLHIKQIKYSMPIYIEYKETTCGFGWALGTCIKHQTRSCQSRKNGKIKSHFPSTDTPKLQWLRFTDFPVIHIIFYMTWVQLGWFLCDNFTGPCQFLLQWIHKGSMFNLNDKIYNFLDKCKCWFLIVWLHQ